MKHGTLAALGLLAAACSNEPAAPRVPAPSLAQSPPPSTYVAIDLGINMGGGGRMAIDERRVARFIGSAPDGSDHVYAWDNGVLTDLGALPSNTTASAMSPGGVVGGLPCGPDGCYGNATTAFTWDRGAVRTLDF